MTNDNLYTRHCMPCTGGMPPLGESTVHALLAQLDAWELHTGSICKTFDFKNYNQVLTFVNAVAWMSQREDHHPDMAFGYNRCRVEYATHAIGGLSENDFICAAKVDTLFRI